MATEIIPGKTLMMAKNAEVGSQMQKEKKCMKKLFATFSYIFIRISRRAPLINNKLSTSPTALPRQPTEQKKKIRCTLSVFCSDYSRFYVRGTSVPHPLFNNIDRQQKV